MYFQDLIQNINNSTAVLLYFIVLKHYFAVFHKMPIETSRRYLRLSFHCGCAVSMDDVK